MDVDKIVKLLGLKPHPGEGGFYRETYRSDEKIPASALPRRYTMDKHFSTAIYYLITSQSFSAIHRIHTDEIFHFYLGDPATMLQLHPDGRGEVITLGQDIEAGQRLQVMVQGGVWQGMFLNEGGRFALMGTTVAPAFDFTDFVLGEGEKLIREYPKYIDLIQRLTHPGSESD
jgi:predicted cupin superfamily sugar epimerase